MADENTVRPVPGRVRTTIGMALDGVLDQDVRFRVWRSMEAIYTEGYEDGWVAGVDEERLRAAALRDKRDKDAVAGAPLT